VQTSEATASGGSSDPAPYVPEVGDVVSFEWSGDQHMGIVFQHEDWRDCIAITDGCIPKVKWCSGIKFIAKTDSMGGTHSGEDAVNLAKAYFSKPVFAGSYVECQKQWCEHYGIEGGSMVKVVRKFEQGEGGFPNDHKWNNRLDVLLGKVTEVFLVEPGKISVRTAPDKDRYWEFDYIPYFALEPAE
jgi:hypothetical protein